MLFQDFNIRQYILYVVDSNGNITYGKIEPNYRKTDGFMAFVNTIVILDEIPEEMDYKEIDFGVYTY